MLISLDSCLEQVTLLHLEFVLQFGNVGNVIYLINDGHQIQYLVHILLGISFEWTEPTLKERQWMVILTQILSVVVEKVDVRSLR